MTVASFNMTTAATLLRSVSGVNVLNRFSSQDSLIAQEVIQLEVGPITQKGIESSTQLLFFPDIKLFQYKGIKRKGNYLFADAMVSVFNETVLFSAEFAKQTYCGFSAFVLQTLPKIFVFPFDITKMLRVMELIVAENTNMFTASINTKNSSIILSRWKG